MAGYKVNRRAFAGLMERRLKSEPDAYLLKTFMRLECFPEMLLYGKAKPTPEWAIRSALDFFSWRFPTFVIAIYSRDRLWIRTRRRDVGLPGEALCREEKKALDWLRGQLKGMVAERFETGVEWSDKHFETFFDSSTIESRRNPKLQRRLMPKNFFGKGSVEYRSLRDAKKIKPNTSLKQFS